MDVRQILVVKVYRKKEMQEIRDRASGRVTECIIQLFLMMVRIPLI